MLIQWFCIFSNFDCFGPINQNTNKIDLGYSDHTKWYNNIPLEVFEGCSKFKRNHDRGKSFQARDASEGVNELFNSLLWIGTFNLECLEHIIIFTNSEARETSKD